MVRKNSNIFFIQPGYAHYRNELFRIISSRHDIHFIYETSSNVYPGEVKPGEISHTFLDKEYKISKFGLLYFFIKYRPKIVITSVSDSFRSFATFLYTKIFKKKFVLWMIEWKKRSYSSHPIKGIPIWRKITNLISRKIILDCDALTAGGTASRKYAMSLGKSDDTIFYVINCSNDLRKMNNNVSFKKISDKNKITFLYMSRIIERKGLDLLIKAFTKLRQKRDDVRLIIAGDGPFKKSCEKLTIELSTQDVSFVGEIHPSMVIKLYLSADIFVLPSRYEPWGLVINEAMSLSLPIITTKGVAAAYDLVKEGYNGCVAKENSVKDLYLALNKIIRLDIKQMGKNSRDLFEQKNNYNKMADGFSEAIKFVTSREIDKTDEKKLQR